VTYRITKEIGTGWSESLDCQETAWGVSESQQSRAASVEPGDIFLHFIDYAHAWAGYSTVTGELRKNDRDSHADWLAALPYVIPIERATWLDVGQCEGTLSIPGLSHQNFHRQATFTRLQDSDAECIIAAIDEAVSSRSEPSESFRSRWNAHAEGYYKGIVKGLARGRCQLCGEDAGDWSRRCGVALSGAERASLRETFLDAAHIVADHQQGSMTPDNLRALCPTCHRMVDRLSDERRAELLTNLKPAGGVRS
jgi:5-methylcytosine-specific restriction endonuclease McrA